MTVSSSYISRVVKIGRLTMGGYEDVRIQSMTNTPTLDTEASYRQVTELYEAGCDLVRLTARNIREAENIGVIRTMLERNGIYMPLAADIHFNPRVAERAATIVHKIRINPGNYLDRQYFLSRESVSKDREYHPELIKEEIGKLTKICREHGTVIRVGVNHGSLSERVLMQYGNTADGMVFSAMEFLRLCRDEGFNDLVVSMKSSHIPTMVKATIGIVDAMRLEGMDYPIHLGVTEAGAGEDGRIRSAAGIGPLLAMGIGDTIRVSLTEDPVKEIPVAKKIALIHKVRRLESSKPAGINDLYRDRRQTKTTGVIGGDNPVAVVSDTASFDDPLRKADLILASNGAMNDRSGQNYPVRQIEVLNMLEDLNPPISVVDEIPVFHVDRTGTSSLREIFPNINIDDKKPYVIRLSYAEDDFETFQLKASSDISLFLLKGFGNGFWLENYEAKVKLYPDLVFSILQAAGVRISGTEYISCPGCGRTEFDLEKILDKIKENTRGMNNVKIAVMGCIVNGPGEMAGADYGYVGSGKGRVTLYRAGIPVKKNIPEALALEELLKLIKS